MSSVDFFELAEAECGRSDGGSAKAEASNVARWSSKWQRQRVSRLRCMGSAKMYSYFSEAKTTAGPHHGFGSDRRRFLCGGCPWRQSLRNCSRRPQDGGAQLVPEIALHQTQFLLPIASWKPTSLNRQSAERMTSIGLLHISKQSAVSQVDHQRRSQVRHNVPHTFSETLNNMVWHADIHQTRCRQCRASTNALQRDVHVLRNQELQVCGYHPVEYEWHHPRRSFHRSSSSTGDNTCW